jgi:hypothetical protein
MCWPSLGRRMWSGAGVYDEETILDELEAVSSQR